MIGWMNWLGVRFVMPQMSDWFRTMNHQKEMFATLSAETARHRGRALRPLADLQLGYGINPTSET